ncbi:MAG: hypothetical protein U0992_05070 [Planctomycetaceae bacterium]
MRTPMSTACCVLGIALFWTAAGFGQDVSPLLQYIPADANTLSVLRVKELTQSPRGQKEGWAQKHESEFLQGAVTIPPWVDVLVRGSYVRPGTQGGEWTVVVLPLPAGADISLVAKREESEVQDLGGLQSVQSHRYNGYFVEFPATDNGRHILGGIAPATRQDTSRWVQEVRGRGRPSISEYLSAAAAETSAQIVLAIDLHDLFDPATIRHRIDSSEAVGNNGKASAALVVDFQSLQGGAAGHSHRRRDDGRNPHGLRPAIGDEGQFIKPLLVEFLNDAGAAVDELEHAQDRCSRQNRVAQDIAVGRGLRRVLSLITTPPPPSAMGRAEPTPPSPTPAQASSQPDAEASRRYYQAVNRIVEDLDKARSRSSSYTRTAQWHFNFADKIDRLPSAGVDPELLKYGSDISGKLRALGASLRGVAVQVNALDSSVVYNVQQYQTYNSGFDWWWGGARTAWGAYNYGMPTYTNVTSNLAEVRQKQAEVVQQGEPQRTEIWQMIQNERSQVEREMVGKYGAGFQKR